MWVMTTSKGSEGIKVHIGAVQIALIAWTGELICMDGQYTPTTSVKAALTELKRLLDAPPREDATDVG